MQGKRIKSYLGGQVGCKEGANNEKQVQECWMQQALIGQNWSNQGFPLVKTCLKMQHEKKDEITPGCVLNDYNKV